MSNVTLQELMALLGEKDVLIYQLQCTIAELKQQLPSKGETTKDSQ